MSNKYLSNTPCKRGHLGYRYTRNNDCVACAVLRSKEWSKNNRELHNEQTKLSKQRRRSTCRETDRLYRIRTKEQRAEYKRKYYEQNLWRYNAWVAQRRARKLQATPPWLTKEHIEEMRQIYRLSQEKTKTEGTRYHVDHIVPLQGENVCGLHVPWNLQVITATENIVKHNLVVNY